MNFWNKNFSLLISVIIIGVLFWFIGANPLNATLFVSTIMFPIAFDTPGLREKVYSKKYRFSFMRYTFKLNDYLDKVLKKYNNRWVNSFRKIQISFLFTCLLTIISSYTNPLFFFLGWLYLELYLFICKKFQISI